MASDYYTSKQNEISFKQICLDHYKRILEISTSEFTGGYWNYVYSANVTNKSYVTDKRKEFIQAVETLALSLFPHFDEIMKKEYDLFLKQDKKLFDKYAGEDGFIRSGEDNKKIKHSIERLDLMKDLFRNLSCLMYRLDYFKGTTYHEGDDDLFDVDGGNKE